MPLRTIQKDREDIILKRLHALSIQDSIIVLKRLWREKEGEKEEEGEKEMEREGETNIKERKRKEKEKEEEKEKR